MQQQPPTQPPTQPPMLTAGPAARRDRLRTLVAAGGWDALLVTDLVNVRYLTGFTGSNAALLVSAAGSQAVTEDVFCTDGRYATQSAAQVPDLQRVIDRPCDLALAAKAKGRLGFEDHVVTVAGLTNLQSVGPAELGPAGALVEQLRAVKDETEIDAIAAACQVADQAFAALLADGGVRAGRTEREIGLDLDQRMRLLGAQNPAFETIVAAGGHSAIPHHRPTDRAVAAGDFVKFDFGALVDGYHSDMTRTVVIGTPADWQREIYQLVAAAQQAGRDAATVGATGDQVDMAARAVLKAAGYAEFFVHGLGHGVGLQIHEAPSVASGSAAIMEADMCVTVEPGVYLPERGGVRIEDSGVIRSDGYQVLTMTTKDLLEL